MLITCPFCRLYAFCSGAHSNLCVNQIVRNGNEQQKEKYLPKVGYLHYRFDYVVARRHAILFTCTHVSSTRLGCRTCIIILVDPTAVVNALV